MKDLEEQRFLFQILFQIGKNFYGDFPDVATGLWRGLFEPYAMSGVVSAFKSGRTSIEDDPKSVYVRSCWITYCSHANTRTIVSGFFKYLPRVSPAVEFTYTESIKTVNIAWSTCPVIETLVTLPVYYWQNFSVVSVLCDCIAILMFSQQHDLLLVALSCSSYGKWARRLLCQTWAWLFILMIHSTCLKATV